MRTSLRRRSIVRAVAGAFCWLLPGLSTLGSVHAMTFDAVSLDGQTQVISATGQITEDTPDQFAAFLDANPGLRARRPIVFLDSPGGRVLASTELGRLLRRIGATAIVARVQDGQGGAAVARAECFSACVYALIGGSRRVIPASSLVGIHRMFAYEAQVDPTGTTAVVHRRYDNGDLRGFLMRYSSEMGVSPALIAAAEHISSDNLKILSRAEIRRWHLAAAR